MSGSEGRAQGLAPLRLGSPQNGLEDPVLTAKQAGEYVKVTAVGGSVYLSQRGAEALASWLDGTYGRALPRFVGIEGIREDYGVARRTVNLWRQHPEFPEPIQVDGGAAGAVWEASRVDDWVRRCRRPPGPKPQQP